MKWDGIINLKRRSPEAAAAYLVGQKNLLLRWRRQTLKDIEASKGKAGREVLAVILARIDRDIYHIDLIQKMPEV